MGSFEINLLFSIFASLRSYALLKSTNPHPSEKEIFDNCEKLVLEDLGSTQFFSRDGLVASARGTNDSYKIIDYNIVCVTQGKLKDTHSSISVITLFALMSGFESIQKMEQFEMYCYNHRWFVRPKLPGIPQSAVVGNLTTPTRHDCMICIDPNRLPSTKEEHCLPCLGNCRGKCLLDSTCCNVFDLEMKCALDCPKHSKVRTNYQCECEEGYDIQNGRCEIKFNCQCQNEGSCNKDSGECECPKGFAGKYCELCTLEHCLVCAFSELTNSAVCTKEKHVCMLKYVEEPPSFSDLNCNPFRSSGYTLRCAIEVTSDLVDAVKLKWQFIQRNGKFVNLYDPNIRQFLRIDNRVSNLGATSHISTTISANLDAKYEFLGITLDVSKYAISYLLGGAIYCESSLEHNPDHVFVSNVLMLPHSKALNLPPCYSDTVYTMDSDRCLLTAPSKALMAQSDLHKGDEFLPAPDDEDSTMRRHDDSTQEEFYSHDYQDHLEEDYEQLHLRESTRNIPSGPEKKRKTYHQFPHADEEQEPLYYQYDELREPLDSHQSQPSHKDIPLHDMEYDVFEKNSHAIEMQAADVFTDNSRAKTSLEGYYPAEAGALFESETEVDSHIGQEALIASVSLVGGVMVLAVLAVLSVMLGLYIKKKSLNKAAVVPVTVTN